MNARTLGDVPARAARLWGRRTALIFEDQRSSFEDLDRAIADLAGRLRHLGLERGQRVAILMENRPEYLHAYFAVAAAGGVLVPLNTFLAPVELRAMLRDCGASLLLATPEALRRVAPVLSDLPALERIAVFDSGQVRLESGAAAAAREPSTEPIAPHDTAVLIYTSGTTGQPKGVMLTHANLLSNAEACIEAVGVTPRDRLLLCLPMFHSFTEMVGMLAPMVAGMSIVLCEKVDRAQVRRALIRHRPTIFPAVPAVFAAMAQVEIGPVARWLNPVRLYISGGAPLSLDTLKSFERIYRRPLCEGYGLSEASPVVALNPPSATRKPGSIGLPLPGVEVRIADGLGAEAATGETGELLVRGASVMKGYLDRPEETARALEGGWLHTGDLARRDEDRYLFIMGRRKEMLICRGMNVYPREIEEVLESHPRIKEAAVVGVADSTRGEVPVAFVVAGAGPRITEAELKRDCLEKLARYKVPRAFHFVAELPRNAAGKVLKESLKVGVSS